MAEQFPTIPHAFEDRARKYGTRAFLKQKREKVWRDFSWNEIAQAAGKLRAGLIAAGAKPGDRIAILSENSPQWVIVDQAALGLGAVVVPLYTTSGVEETRHVLTDSGARILAVGDDDMMKKVAELGPLPSLETIIAIHPVLTVAAAPNAAPRTVTLEAASAGSAAPISEGKRDDLATLIYTSGTTGTSKGVMLTHGNILSNVADSLAALDLNENDMTLSFLPVAHSFERTAGYYTVMMGGGTIAYAEGLAQIPSNLQEIRPTVLLVVPRLLEAIYDRVQRTVQTGPALRRKLFTVAIKAGQRASEYLHAENRCRRCSRSRWRFSASSCSIAS